MLNCRLFMECANTPQIKLKNKKKRRQTLERHKSTNYKNTLEKLSFFSVEGGGESNHAMICIYS